MDRITRKELKTDKFALEVGHTVEYFEHHKRQVVRYGGVALAVILIAAAYFFYSRSQRTQRQSEFYAAVQIQEAPIGPPGANPAAKTFPTPEARNLAAVKAFTDLATRHPGSEEASISEYYLGTMAADQGNTAEAEKWLKKVSESGNANYASLAKLSLSSIYASTGRTADAERLLRSLMDKPTIFVSKEQATIALARAIAKTRPNDAIKLLEPLRTERSAVSRMALTALAEISGR